MLPTKFPVNEVGISTLSTEEVAKYDHSQYHFFENEGEYAWGNLGTLYLAGYYNPETGEKLEQPIVNIMTLKAKLEETPKLSFSILDDGRPEFSWTPVEGAEDYLVCKIDYSEVKGCGTSMYPMGMTSETTWTTEAPKYDNLSRVNDDFKIFRVSEDEWKGEYYYDLYKDKYEPYQVAYKKDDSEKKYEDAICVIAISKEGMSLQSNFYLMSELAPNLPYRQAENAEKENGFKRKYETVEELPIYDYVVMCDGITNMKLIDYQTEQATCSMSQYFELDENGNLTGESEMVLCLNVPYIVEGTPFYYTMRVEYYDEANMEKDLKFLEDREDSLRKKSGSISPKMAYETIGKEKPGEVIGDTTVREVKDITVFASCALSEYLATSMLGGATCIDISDFPEAKNVSFVDDALMEAYYQNPLILGIKGYRVNRKGTTVRIAYDDSAVEQARKQGEIKDKVAEVTKKIITPGMTDHEKELAINQYLCDTIEYDEDALLSAEENDFEYVDEAFNDSFTAYGALIDGKCVCAGYSAAFKLLSEAAGLESIVVTGYLDGSLAHAWNKIKIDDEWRIVDVTNNDSEYLSNALFNLPSAVGDRVLVEEIAAELAADLADDGKALLRTDYDLNDEEFYQVTSAVYDILGDEVDLYGYYWIGVIYLTTEK